MRRYAVPDLHGRRDLLDAAIAAIAAHGGGEVVFLGDYIDRGPDSRGVVERLLAGPPPGQIWRPLMGNHEAFLLDALEDPAARDQWLEVGGREALQSYGWDGTGEAAMGLIPVEHRRWMRKLPQVYLDLHRVYVHAGIDPTLSIDHQTETRLLWQIHLPESDCDYRGRHVVHGHESRADGPQSLTNRTNLDTLAWKTGRLCVGVFAEDRPGGPVEILEVKRAPDPRADP